MAKVTVRWTKQALADLRAAREHLTSEYPQFLQATFLQIQSAINQVSQFPGVGREGRVRGTRELIFAQIPFILVYRKTASAIEIISFLHQSRQWP